MLKPRLTTMCQAPCDEFPFTSPVPDPAAGSGAVLPDGRRRRLVVVSNRIADGPPNAASSGGLAVGIQAALKSDGGIWFGWSGEVARTRGGARAHAVGQCHLCQGRPAPQDYEEYYNGFANRVLWPLFHYRPDLDRFPAATILPAISASTASSPSSSRRCCSRRPHLGHDYHLMALGEELRRAASSSPWFFLHTPFPPRRFVALAAPCRADAGDVRLRPYRLPDRERPRRFAPISNSRAGGRARRDGRGERAPAARASSRSASMSTRSRPRRAHRCAPSRQRLYEACATALMVGVDRLDYSKGLSPASSRSSAAGDFPDTCARLTFLQIAPRHAQRGAGIQQHPPRRSRPRPATSTAALPNSTGRRCAISTRALTARALFGFSARRASAW